MSTRFTVAAASSAVCLVLATVVAAQGPRITNAQVRPQAAATGLAGTFRGLVAAQTEVAWIAYTVPVTDRNGTMCCWSNDAPCCASCRLEPSTGGSAAKTATGASPPQGPVKLEGPERMVVLFRVVDRQVERIRTYSDDCELDAGGRPVLLLQDVRPADSIALLESLVGVEADRKNKLTSPAIAAISMHGDPSAAATIERLARTHAAPAVRGDAIFWLAQLAGARVGATITAAIENDPDTEVKKRAVFALSQLPRSEGIPLLIDVARKNPNPVVKKQAIFWLGQSKDPRALDFFAEILK
jgi:hypothetical protein